MDIYGVIGNPIGHSRSPFIHETFARQTGIELEYKAILAPLDAFRAEVERFRAAGGRGLNVTVPFKREAFQLCDRTSTRAQRAGAVNTLRFATVDGHPFIEGDNTDGIGLVRDLAFLHVPVSGKRVLILGAGGAVRGVLEPLLSCNPKQLTIVNRRVERAEELVRDFADCAGNTRLTSCGYSQLGSMPALAAFDLIINATPASLEGDMPELDLRAVGHHAIAYDMAYGSQPTVFMHWADEQGASATHDGLGMLVEQAAESFHYWHGVRPQTAPLREQLRRAL